MLTQVGDNTCDQDDISIASTSSDGALFGSNGAATQAASPLWAKLENERHCAPQDAPEVHEKSECLETYCGRRLVGMWAIVTRRTSIAPATPGAA